MATFNVNDVLSVQPLPQGRAGVWFLNWNITAKPMSQRPVSSPSEYAGAGLYGLCFDDQLIYIGSYLGSGKAGASFSGDVVQSRWWTHIGAITARGSRMHIAPTSLDSLVDLLEEGHTLLAGFLATEDRQKLHSNNGNLSPLRRLLFAARWSDVFLTQDVVPQEVLSRFTFVYVRYEEMPQGMDALGLQSHIENAEAQLIRRLAPVCNSTHVPAGALPVPVRCADVQALLLQALHALDQAQEPAAEATVMPQQDGPPEPPNGAGDNVQDMPDPEPEDPASVFWARLPAQPHEATAIVDSLLGLARRLGVQEVYTATAGADLRFKTRTNSGRQRVFMTLSWQSRAQRFLIRSLCPTHEALICLGALRPHESALDTTPPEPQRSELKVLADAGRLMALRRVFLQALQQARQLD